MVQAMTVAFLHTVTTLPEVFDELADERSPASSRCVVTCSSIGAAVDESSVRALRIDEPMADEAVRVGVLATLATTLVPRCTGGDAA
jgi:hypothetical protein